MSQAMATRYELVADPALEFPAILRGKKLLLATESFGDVNGVSRTTGQLVSYLRDNGVHVAVIAPVSPSHPLSTVSVNNPEIRLKGYPLPYNPELSVVFPFRFNRLISRTFQPDLVYLASPASVGFQILLQLRRLAKRPIVLCNFQTDLSGYCEILFPWPLSAWAVWAFGVVQGWLFSHPSVKTVFYPSLFVRRYLERQGIPTRKMLSLRRGVNTALFSPSKRSASYRREVMRLAEGQADDKVLLISVSRLAPEKGFGFLSDVAHRLHHDGFPFHLMIVGGNRNIVVEADVCALFADIAGHVTFTGFLMGGDLARAYASADIKVHSSITETFGLVVLEAMASGLPVVARDEGGPSEIVVHDEAGYLVAPDDVSDFVAKVEKLGYDRTLLEESGRKARWHAEQATWDKINNRVAWQLAETLESSAVSDTPAISACCPSSATTWQEEDIPFRKILLRRPLLFSGILAAITSLYMDAEISFWIAIIVGVWSGLILTFAAVLCVQFVQSAIKRSFFAPLISHVGEWRQERLRRRVAGNVQDHGDRVRA